MENTANDEMWIPYNEQQSARRTTSVFLSYSLSISFIAFISASFAAHIL
jgi:hypothetical protein